jgi:hypothetical protein
MIRTLSIAAGVALVALAACGSSAKATLTPPSTATSPVPDFPIVLDDGGLKLPPGPTPAGIYRVSFADRRTKRGAGRHVDIRFRPSGPLIELDRVRAGASDNVTLLPNLVVYLTIDDVTQGVEIENQLDVRPTARYSTPVT